MKKRNSISSEKRRRRRSKPRPDYVLQGTEFDLPMETVLGFSGKQRRQYINALFDAIYRRMRRNKFSLKPNVSFKKEIRDLRKLLYAPADQYLFVDDKTHKRNVLGKGSPGSTHTYWSQSQMWKMKTKGGDLSAHTEKSSGVGQSSQYTD